MSRETKVPSIPDAGISSTESVLSAIKQLLDVREGHVGDKMDSNVTYRDLVLLGLAQDATGSVQYNPTAVRGNGNTVIPNGVDPDGYDPTIDLTPPPPPENVVASGSIGVIFVTWDQPAYKNHQLAEVWRAETDDIGAATKIATSSSQGYMDSPNAKEFTYYYWIRFVSKANVNGPYSQESASAKASTDPKELIKIIEKDFLESDFVKNLSSRIDLIDGPSELANSVNARMLREFTDRVAAVSAEASTRAQAILDEAAARGAAITNEQTVRQNADLSLASNITTLTASVNTNNQTLTSAIQAEAQARADGDSAEATQRNTLATQLRGGYTGNNLADITTGLIFQERQARSSQDGALAQQISLLTAGVSGGFDPYKTWHFDSSVDGWTSSDASLSVGNGFIKVTPTGANPAINLASDFSPGFIGAAYRIVKARIKRVSGTGWVGKLRWKTTAHGFSATYEKTIADPGIAVGTTNIVDWDLDGTTDWTGGTITNIQILLGTSGEVFDVDWVSVGRNAPAASTASILEEASARADADSAEVTARELLSTVITGTTNPSGLTLNTVTGLIGDEKTARTTADSSEASSRQLLSTAIIGFTTPTGVTLNTAGGLIGDERTTRSTAISNQNQVISGLSSKVDVKITVYSQASMPTTPKPGTSFVVGDLWFDTDDNNKMYRWNGTTFTPTDDGRIQSISTNVSSLQETYAALEDDVNAPVTGLATRMNSVEALAASKNKTYRQSAAPSSGLETGDIWFDTSDGTNKPYRWNGSAWVLTEDTRIPQNAASIVSLETTKIGYATLNSTGEPFDNGGAIKNKAGVDTWNAANPGNLATWNVGIPLASAVKQVRVSDGLDTVAIEQRFTTQRGTNNTLLGQYSVKIDNNGHVSGFGLSSTSVNGTPTSAFIIRADKFAIVDPASTTNNLTNNPSTDSVPFAYVSGVPNVPNGVYIKSAFIQDATITSAKIASLTANKITAGYINAVVGISSAKVHGTELYSGGSTTSQTDGNGNIIGFTTANPTCSIVGGVATFVASAFRISNSASGSPTNYFPFQVIDNIVYLNTARIKDGTITTAHIENANITNAQITSLDAGKITSGTISTPRLNIDSAVLTATPGGLLTIKGGAITDLLISDQANINGAKIGSLNVGKLTGDVTKFITGYIAPSGAIPDEFTSYLTLTLPKSDHAEGHKPYIQVSIRDAAPYQVGGYLEVYAATVGDGTSVPALGPILPASQQYWTDYDPDLGYPQLKGWTLFFSGEVDIQIGDTITNDNSESGTVTYALFTGTQTMATVEVQGSLGSYYTRTRPVLGNGVIGPYTLVLDTYWDAYDMTSVALFGGLTQTKQSKIFNVKLKAQWAGALYIRAIDVVVMGIR
jgi:hypothetical protein